MLNSIRIFVSDIKCQPDGVSLNAYWTPAVRKNTTKFFTELLTQNQKKLEIALNKDIEQQYFPIRVEIMCTSEYSLAYYEIHSINITDVCGYSHSQAQVYFRTLIKKMCSTYFYPPEVQKKVTSFLKKVKYDFRHEPVVYESHIYNKEYTSVKEFDNDLKNLISLFKDNLENVDKAMFE